MKLLLLVIDFILIFWAIIYITKTQINIKQISTYVLVISCPTALIFLLIGQWQGIIFLIISLCIYFLYLTKNAIIFIHIFFIVTIGILSDNIIQYFLLIIPFKLFSSILVQYLIFVILFIINIIIYKLATRTFYNLFNKIKGLFLLILFVAFFTMSTFYINLYFTDYLSTDNLLTFNIVTQVTYFIIMIFILYITNKNLKKENEFQKIKSETTQFINYMSSLELINNDMQKFRHDHNNILFTIQGYIDTNDFEGLKAYFKEHIFSLEEDTLKKNKQLANLYKLKITGIKGLLITKTLQAEKEGISVNIEIPDIIEKINMNIIDLTRILGILLDNAIEAKSNIDSKNEINIAFFKNISNSLIIIIENTIEETTVNIDQIFNDGFSTKGQNRGKGLSIIKNIFDNYSNASLNTNITNGLFTQIILIE